MIVYEALIFICNRSSYEEYISFLILIISVLEYKMDIYYNSLVKNNIF